MRRKTSTIFAVARIISALYVLHVLAAFSVENKGINVKKFGRYPSQLFQQQVDVWDGVFDPAYCARIDLQAKVGGLGHTVYNRALAPRTAVEQAINSVLLSLGDVSPLVEYWWRQEWMSLELHRDIDEKRSQQQPEVPIIIPQHAHVLYLHAGEGVRGPTVVLHDRGQVSDNQGTLLTALAPAPAPASDAQQKQQFEKLSLVPAVAGRLLRFDGSMAHAVPRPALAFLDAEEGGSNLELWTRRRPRDETDPELTTYRRSVLMFNTWRATNEPPLGVDVEPPLGTLACHVAAGSDGPPLSCNAHAQWRSLVCDQPQSTLTGDESRPIHLKIGILGDNRRRGRTERYLHLDAPHAIKSALEDDARMPQTFYVTEQ